MIASHTRRSGRIVWWIIGTLLIVFAGIMGVLWWNSRDHFSSDADLMAELADATLESDGDDKLDPRSWPDFLGTNRRGVAAPQELLTSWPARGPKRAWKAESGRGYSSFTAVDGLVWTMLSLQGDREAVVCWELDSGKEKWRYPYPSKRNFDYAGTRATPVIDGENLYTISPAGLLLCLKARTGKFVWKTDVTEEVGGRPPNWGYAFSPLVDGDKVFVMPGGPDGKGLAAFNKKTGKVAWTSQDDPPGYSSPVAVTVGGVRQVLFFTGTRLVSVDHGDGELLWAFDFVNKVKVNAATPVVIKAKSKKGEEFTYVFISSGYRKGCALLKIIENKGSFSVRRVYESNELECHFATPVRFGDHLYGMDERRDLTCLNIRTGKVAWRFEKEGEGIRNVSLIQGSLIRAGKYLIVLGAAGKLALLEATPDAYREVTAFRAFRSDQIWSLPVLIDGRLLIRDRRDILCLDIRKAVRK